MHSTEGNWKVLGHFLPRRKILLRVWRVLFNGPYIEAHICLTSHRKLKVLHSNMFIVSRNLQSPWFISTVHCNLALPVFPMSVVSHQKWLSAITTHLPEASEADLNKRGTKYSSNEFTFLENYLKQKFQFCADFLAAALCQYILHQTTEMINSDSKIFNPFLFS